MKSTDLASKYDSMRFCVQEFIKSAENKEELEFLRNIVGNALGDAAKYMETVLIIKEQYPAAVREAKPKETASPKEEAARKAQPMKTIGSEAPRKSGRPKKTPPMM